VNASPTADDAQPEPGSRETASLTTARPAAIGAHHHSIASITSAAHERWRTHRNARRLADTADAGFHAVTTDPETSPAKATAKRLAAGAMSTMAVRTLLAPFERMKLEYMLNRSTTPLIPAVKLIFAKEGARGFWKGNFVNLLRTTPYKAINFAAFDAYKGVAVMACGGDPKDVDKILLAVAGAAAGVTSVSSCFPMDVVRTRLLVTGGMKKYGGVAACIRTLYTREGIGAFYRGFLPAIIAMTPNGAVYYTVYDRLKARRIKQIEAEREVEETKGKKGSGKQTKGGKQTNTNTNKDASGTPRVEQHYMMLFGAIAGATAEFSTYPFEVVRRRMQLQGGTSSMSQVFGSEALRRMTMTLNVIVKKKGLAGLYVGAAPSVMQVLPSAALGYYSYEMFKLLVGVD
jgi:solute carrier family 25 phosphate transporter 23/24/25/41